MPKVAMNYQNNVIYKIQHKTIDELIYIGSTTNFAKRKNHHKHSCNNEKGIAYNEKKYVMIRENGGWDMFNMVLVKKYPCNDNLEAFAEEERIRREMNANMNAIRCFATQEELKQNVKKYRETHKEETKKYRESHKEETKEYNKQYYETKKEEISEKQQQYRETHKEEIYKHNKTKVNCECGCFISNRNLSTHKKSPKHQMLLSAKLLK